MQTGMAEGRRLTILHVVRLSEGGMRRHVMTLLSGLGEGFQQTLASSPDLFDFLPAELRARTGFAAAQIGDRTGPGAIWQGIVLARVARRIRAGIVHSHGYRAAVPGVIGARLSGARSVVTGHNLFPAGASAAARASVRLVSRLSDRIIAVSPAVAESLVGAGVAAEKIVIIPNGMDLSAYRGRDPGKARSNLALGESARIVLCAARLTEVKGIEYLVRAAALIRERNPAVRVIVAGDGPDRAKLEDLSRQVAPETVIFLGQRDDVPDLLAGADAVAVPSLAEGHPLIVSEAMASGKPIVASAVGGLVDVITDSETGFLVGPADPEALAAAILKVIDSPEMADRLGKSARRYAEENLSAERMISRTEEVYRCVGS